MHNGLKRIQNLKKNTLSTLLVLVRTLFPVQYNAQNTYTYTLIDNGGCSFTIAAVADSGETNEVTEVQSYGFTILLLDGITMSIISSLGGAFCSWFSYRCNRIVYSMNGKRTLSVDDYAGKSINISTLSSGLYLVSIESKEVRRLVIK